MRRAAGVLGTLGLLLLVSFSFSPSAEAHHLTAGSDGKYVWCAVRVSNTTLGSSFDWWMSCTSAASTRFATAAEGFAHTGVRIWIDSAAWSGADRRDAAVNSIATVDTLSGAQLRSHGTLTWPASCIGDNDPSACRTAISITPDDSPTSDNIDTIELKKADGSGFTFSSSQYDANHPAKIDSIVLGGSGHPAYPPEGGTPPTTAQDGSCAVLKEEAGEGVYRARLRATVDDPDASDVLTVDHGDGAAASAWTSGTAYWHYFPAPDPGEVYTVTYTVERDGQDDETCAVDVNFFDEALDSGTFGTGSPDDGEGDEESESCGFFDVVCWLKKLFIPDGDAIAESADELHTAASEHWPLGPGFDAATGVEQIADDAEEGSSTGEAPTDDFVHEGAPGCTSLRLPLDFTELEDSAQAELPILGECPGGFESQGPTSPTTDFWDRMQDLTMGASVALSFVAGIFVVKNAADKVSGDGSS